MKSPILITGGSQRLGLALCQSLTERDQSVIITYRREKPVIAELQAKGVVCIQTELSDRVSIEKLVTQVKALTPSLRAIIHNASDWLSESLTEDSLATLSHNFRYLSAIHAEAPYLLNVAFGDLLTNYYDTNGVAADLVHITDYVVNKGSANHLAYAASKAALDNLNKGFAQQFAPKVKCNTIAPAMLAFNDSDDAAYRSKVAKKSLLPPAPGFAEAVAAVDYLLQSTYITGQTLSLDGGRALK